MDEELKKVGIGLRNPADDKGRRVAKHDPSRNEYQKKYQKNRYHERKKEAIRMLGGKCAVCGTTKNLELDHKNPDNKSFNVTKLWSVPEAEFKREVKKCKLLCNKHHRERTGKQRENGEVKSIPGKTQYDSKGRKTKSRRKKASHLRSLATRVAEVARDLNARPQTSAEAVSTP